jgi:hypothetical protein
MRNADFGWPVKRATLMRNKGFEAQIRLILQSEIRNPQSEMETFFLDFSGE